MKPAWIIAIAASTFVAGCASTDPFSEFPANAELQREITTIIGRVKIETGAVLYDDLKRLVAFDVFAVKQVCELSDDPNARIRSNALWVLAQIKDPDHKDLMAKIDRELRHGLDDSEPTVRYEAAAGLASRAQWDVLPILIDGLANADSGVRFRCHQQLLVSTSRDFGFKVDASPEVRTTSIERWRAWYADWKKTQG